MFFNTFLFIPGFILCVENHRLCSQTGLSSNSSKIKHGSSMQWDTINSLQIMM